MLNPFQGLKKGSVLQNVRMFSTPKLDIKESYFLLTKILFILHGQGEQFTQDEATTVFIAVTKLFQCTDVSGNKMKFSFLLTILAWITSNDVFTFERAWSKS